MTRATPPFKIGQALERPYNGTCGYCDETGNSIGFVPLDVYPIETPYFEA